MIIRSEEIYNKAQSIVKSCGTRDTLKIARELGIYVHYLDNLNDLLGMYTYRHKERHILLNSKMEEMVMQMVCGHEIGHDVFHRLRKDVERLIAGLFLDDVKRTVDDLLCNALLAVEHDAVDELGHEDTVVHRIGQNFSLGNITSSGHFASLLHKNMIS